MAKRTATKTARICVAVPEDRREILLPKIYQVVIKDDPESDDYKILTMIENNPHLTAPEITWQIEKQYGIRRRPSAIKNFAKRVGLQIKEIS